MSARHPTSCARAVRTVVAALALASCDSTNSLARDRDDPQLLLVLTPDTVFPGPAHTALLLTTGTPLSARFREAERFELRRLEDGAVFRWRSRPVPANLAPDFRGAYLPDGGNFVLAESVSADGLRVASVSGGATYVLDLVTEGRHVTGMARVPATPVARVIESGGVRRVVWSSSAGAAAYLVVAETDRITGWYQLDTTYVLHYDALNPPASPRVRIRAVDSTMLTFLKDTTLGSAGLTGAYGLFSGAATTTIDVPRSAP